MTSISTKSSHPSNVTPLHPNPTAKVSVIWGELHDFTRAFIERKMWTRDGGSADWRMNADDWIALDYKDRRALVVFADRFWHLHRGIICDIVAATRADATPYTVRQAGSDLAGRTFGQRPAFLSPHTFPGETSKQTRTIVEVFATLHTASLRMNHPELPEKTKPRARTRTKS